MARVRITQWDVADHLSENADRLAYLDAALETGEASVIAAALGDVARAAGMARVAADAQLGRESLYKALSADGNLELATVRETGWLAHAAQPLDGLQIIHMMNDYHSCRE